MVRVAVFVCLSALVTLGQGVSVPRSYVVSKGGGPTPATPVDKPTTTTAAPVTPIKLLSLDVDSVIRMRYAHTAIVTVVENPAERAQEATIRIIIPDTAFITGLIMTLGDKSYKAYVKEKEEAKQIYSDAVSRGVGAATVAATARDSTHFSVTVNVEPFSKAKFNLTYEELLVLRNGVYNHAINLHPGGVVPKMRVTVHIQESAAITVLRVPEVRTGNEVDATEKDAQNSLVEIERCEDDNEAFITFEPDEAEQRRLMDVYAKKEKEDKSVGVYKPAAVDGVLGQFVVQYDVERPNDGQILVNDGYFVHFFAPSNLPPLSKHVVFVLDTSGSMSGRKIEQLRDAMQTILSDLNPGDYFNLVQFETNVNVYDMKEADEPPKKTKYSYTVEKKPVTLVPPSLATPDNIAKAKILVKRLEATGSTNISGALTVAVDLVRKGVGWTSSNTTNNTEVAKVKEDVKPEPIIIFLTDGEPTVGETKPKRIIDSTSELNSGPDKAPIFCLAFGDSADRNFLRKLALRNDGFMRPIYEAADASLQLQDFYRQVSSPLIAHLTFEYPPEQVEEETVTKSKFRLFYFGSEAVVAGRVAVGAEQLAPRVVGVCGVNNTYRRRRYEIFPRIPIVHTRDTVYPLERLWAYLTVKQLLDERDAQDLPADKNITDPLGKRALQIALKYEFVTPLTSLVVVKPNETDVLRPDTGRPGSGQFGAPGLPGGPAVAYSKTTLSNSLPGKPGIAGAPVRLSPAPSGPVSDVDSSAPSSPTTSRLAALHLEKYPWVEPALKPNADAISLDLGANKTAELEFTRNTNAPKEGADASCARAVDGAAGACVYLTRCSAATNITLQDYKLTYCYVSNKYAGVCCPKSKVDVPSN